MSFQEFHRTTGILTSHIDLKIVLQPFISSEMVKTVSWPCAAYPEFALSVGLLHQKHGELGIMSLFSKDQVKPQTETGRIWYFNFSKIFRH